MIINRDRSTSARNFMFSDVMLDIVTQYEEIVTCATMFSTATTTVTWNGT